MSEGRKVSLASVLEGGLSLLVKKSVLIHHMLVNCCDVCSCLQ